MGGRASSGCVNVYAGTASRHYAKAHQCISAFSCVYVQTGIAVRVYTVAVSKRGCTSDRCADFHDGGIIRPYAEARVVYDRTRRAANGGHGALTLYHSILAHDQAVCIARVIRPLQRDVV
ncbi:hypothetical protein SDC9_81492 [bioreactor metagenome]|uniref:Uncharacterized protein n=1 Tax=bioreactor metagenome TaxID=1076179 RepID=A0A644Z2B8_9ZZZZ